MDIKKFIIFALGNIFYFYFIFTTLIFEQAKAFNTVKMSIFLIFVHAFIYNFFFIKLFKKLNREKILKHKQETFIATVVHDLKSPTFAQIKALELVLNNYYGRLTNAQENIIFQIKESCEYMKDLILTILNTYLYDNGQIQTKFEIINFPELVIQTIDEFSVLLKEKEQKIIFSKNTQNKEFFADKLQLKRVLANLITNAITYGKPRTEIKICITEDENSINFSITNISNYIPENEITHIFEKFTSPKKFQYEKTGTKLGLYLTKEIINSHNGEIYAKSMPDGICEFGFSIPKNTTISKFAI